MNTNRNIYTFRNARGKIEYGMTNDYMFHVVLQRRKIALTGLTSSVLHIPIENITSVEITNPIEPGDEINEKTFVMDIHVVLNNHTHLNLEMQVTNEKNWEDRSLSYLCRTYDQLYKGDDYTNVKPVIHIGFLNFTPFPDFPEFYAKFKLINEKTGMVYSDKFLLNVIDLTQIDLATEEDKTNQIDYWARLFTATTWEEVIMLTENNPALAEAAQAIYEINADDKEKLKCRARHDYYKMKNIADAHLQKVTEERDAYAIKIESLTQERNAFAKQNKLLTEEIDKLKSQLAKNN